MIERVGRLPTGTPAAVIRGLSRARIGSGVPGPGAALWVEAVDFDEPEPTGRTRELAREYKNLITADLQRRGAWQVIDAVERMSDPAELADSSGYAPWLSLAQKAQLLEAADVNTRLELLVGWTRDHIAELEVAERIGEDVREGLEKLAARVPAAPAAQRDPQGARRGRARRCGRLPHPGRGGRPAGEGPGGRAA